MKKNLLQLTAAESTLFESLPETVREGWQVQTESLKSYESKQELKVRASIAGFDDHPSVQKLLQKIQSGGEIDRITIDDIPQNLFEELIFTIGARGLDYVIRALLRQTKTDDDLQGVKGLSLIRHTLLETNRSVSYA